MIDNLIVNVLKSSDYPYIINIIHNKHINITQQNQYNNNNTYIDISINEITNNTIDHSNHIIETNIQHETDHEYEFNEISLEYEQYEQWNEIQMWNTPHRHRRRLRQCHKRAWRPFHYYTKRYWCKPIAPPKWDPYWIRRFKRIGRFIAVYPGIQAKNKFNFKKCAAFCRQNYGGLASIHSTREKDQAKAACWYMLTHPKAKNQRDYAGNWRGHSCFIGLKRHKKKFNQWEDKSKMNYKFWQPGEPNNGGHRRVCTSRNWWGGCRKYQWRKNANEDCTELYAFHYGRWNDISCNAKRSCLCQKPRGQIHGPYIGVSATRTYKEAHLYCKITYGTTLATIHSDKDNEHAMNACKAVTQIKSLGHCWIGLQRPFNQWNDGTDANSKYTNWYKGEPNNKNEKCVEMYSEHEGLWNDLSCNYKRYFLCNAQTAIQRMTYSDREKMIQQRMRRHKQTWQQYQARAKRAKIRKMYFDEMRKRQKKQRAQQRKQLQQRREYMRQMAFNKFSGHMKSRLGSFSANSKFGDIYAKRRRMRYAIEQESYAYQRQINQEIGEQKAKYKKKQMFKKDKKLYRDMEDSMWEDETMEMESSVAEMVQERVNVSPKRCVLVTVDGGLYEICVNDDFVFVKKFVERVQRMEDDDFVDESEHALYDVWSDYNVTLDGGDNGFEVYKYEKAVDVDDMQDLDGEIEKVESEFKYVRVDEFMYDFDSNHKKQCFGNGRIYRVCMEYLSVEKDVVVYVGIDGDDEFLGYDEDMYLFGEDSQWNEVEYVSIGIDGDERKGSVNDKTVKCLMFYGSKICVIERFGYDDERNSEYRIVILTEMSEDDEYGESDGYGEYD